MKVLLLTQVLPYPPDSGPKVKTWNLVKYLTRQHEVTLVSYVRGDQSREIRHLEGYCRAVHTMPITRSLVKDGLAMIRSLVTGEPWMMARDDRREMRALVERLGQETAFDVAHADQLNMAQFALLARARRTVLDEHNALWLLYKRLAETMPQTPRRWLLERDWRLLREYEGRMCEVFDHVLAVSEQDRIALMEAMSRPRAIQVIPIAVDTDEVKPVAWTPSARRIVHIGTMYWPPNIDGVLWFIKEIFPRLREQLPGLVFDVIGARPPKEISDWGDAGLGVNVTGYVDDPGAYLEQAGVMVIPLRAGGGMRVKILNALAQGLPMVTTALGCEGIDVQHGRHLMIADSVDTFVDAVLQVLNDPDLATQLSNHAIELARSTYDYRSAYRPLDKIYSTPGNSHGAA